ncbi:hypothetical protein [Actinomycetospora sp. CA-053990]|uniref:hypothetical protein n=1 Tax=Actinomycetospora sp. CA-053990 TaxID=3239891 RepID=UPI003D8A6EDD
MNTVEPTVTERPSSANECFPCGAELSGDSYLCNDCAQRLLGELSGVRALVEDLDLSITRQTASGTESCGRRGNETPLAFEEKASEALKDLQAVLLRWCRAVVVAAQVRSLPAVYATRDPRDPSRLPAQLTEGVLAARLLVEHYDTLRMLGNAGEAYVELMGATRDARRAIDRKVAKRLVGECGAEVDEVLCNAVLYVRAGDDDVVCPTCGTVWGVHERRAWLKTEADWAVGTTAQIAGLMSAGGVETSGQNVRRWARQGWLAAVGADDRARPLYRLGDAFSAHERIQDRKKMLAEKRAENAAREAARASVDEIDTGELDMRAELAGV